MKNYYRIKLGQGDAYASEAYTGNFVAVGYIFGRNLTGRNFDSMRDFNREFIPVFLEQNPGRAKIAAGLACGNVWAIFREVQIGDVVLCPYGDGNYHAGEVVGGYEYRDGKDLPHRRPVKWFPRTIALGEMSELLKTSVQARGTVININTHSTELDALLSGSCSPIITATDETGKDPSVCGSFLIEKQLEEFLVAHWEETELGRQYHIYEEDGGKVGQQYPSTGGPIDILAVSNDKKELLVVELKRGRTADAVVGQVQRYMGAVKEQLAEDDQKVRGAIVAFEGDENLRLALLVAPDIDFYTYKLDFKLEKK